MAEYAEREGYTFGLVSNAVASYSSKWMSVPAGGGSLQLEAVLESLAMAGPFWVAELSAVLRTESDALTSDATVVVVTAILSRAVVNETEQIRRRGHRVAVFYAGDGPPGPAAAELPPEVPVYLAGSSLATLEDVWRDDWSGDLAAEPTLVTSEPAD